MLQRIDSRELSEWMAYFRLENERMAKGNEKEEPVGDKIKKVFNFPGGR
jgi:hypothetical protein